MMILLCEMLVLQQIIKQKMMQDSGLKQASPQIITATVIGDVRVGKTTLVRRACNLAVSKIVPTIGVEYCSTNIKHKDRDFKIKFWDISGQNRYQNLFHQYIVKSDVAIVVFDLNNYESFHNAKQWVIDVGAKYEDVHIILFGNKKDLYDRNLNATTAVQLPYIKSFVDDKGIIYEEGCALSDNKLTQAIKKMLQRNFIPNEVILQGINQAKTCGCFC